MLKNKTLVLVFFIFFVSTHHAPCIANNLKASLAEIPVHSETDSTGKPVGGFVEVIKALDLVYQSGTISIHQFPFARSLKNIEKGKFDFHIPLIRLPHIPEEALPYSYAREPITTVAFVLYTNAEKPPISVIDLSNYEIETMRGHEHFFPFKAEGQNTIKQSILKIVHGRIDGYIMEQDAVDAYIKANKIKSIRRTHYATWDSCVVVSKNMKGKSMDILISGLLNKLKTNGKLQKITSTIHKPYNNWQPYQMGW